jgi:acyl transferase domain-containing protein/acyl carrier protein/SAM-dependent methyltransferase
MIGDQLNLSAQHPLVGNHRAYGQALLPGLAYIDLIYQIFRLHHYSYTELELRNLTIYHPLVVTPEKELLLRIRGTEVRDGQWRIQLEGGTGPDGTSGAAYKRYATAEMWRSHPPEFTETLDLDRVKFMARRTIDLDEIYQQCRAQKLIHTGFMKAEGKIYELDEAMLLEVALGPEAQPSAAGFMFHPTLIDGSGVGGRLMAAALIREEQRLFLPLFYGSFQATALLQQKCWARIQAASVYRKQDLIYGFIDFFDESGRKVAALKQIVNKLVRQTALDRTRSRKYRQLASGFSRHKPPEAPAVRTGAAEEVSGTAALPVESLLRELLAARLGRPLDRIDTRIGYYEMGLDSPGLLEIVAQLETKTGAALPPTLLFEYPTIRELAAYLIREYAPLFGPGVTGAGGGGRQAAATPGANGPGRAETASTNAAIQNEAAHSGTGSITDAVREDRPGEADIAVIGMACRFPGAGNIREFWSNLLKGKDCVAEIPESRWDWRQFDHVKSASGKNISRWGGFISGPDCFDPKFFRISPREAELMDPQERLFLETCWEAIEDAGYTPQTLVAPRGPQKRRPVGVFVGVMQKDYALLGAESLAQGAMIPLALNAAPIANRVSYFCNFHGPSMVIDTMCSASLTAVHLALESIKRGECEAALVGGVNLSLHPGKYLSYGMTDMHSSDGYCHTFGKGGDGYVSGEAVGAVLLKPLSQAVWDRDHIYAVIKGSAVNHGGTVSGMTVPSPAAQADLIAECLQKTGINPRTISCIEAHGTGTALGDPIELQGLAEAFRRYTPDRQFCPVGSVKSNIGHAEAAAGISGLIKVALQLYHQTLAPSLHAEELNPYIDFENSPFYVQRQTGEWRQPVLTEAQGRVRYPRRAGLSSFGATGSNAHIILEEYLPAATAAQAPAGRPGLSGFAVIPLSAKNEERLRAYVRKLHDFLRSSLANEYPETWLSPEYAAAAKEQEEPLPASSGGRSFRELHLFDLAYTLQVGRESLEERVAFWARDLAELFKKLEAYGTGRETLDTCRRGRTGRETPDLAGADRDAPQWSRPCRGEDDGKRIAELWVQGNVINWELLYEGGKPQRISLPTYPFAKEHYWLPETRQIAAVSSAANSCGAGSGGGPSPDRPAPPATIDHEECGYLAVWEEQPPSQAAPLREPSGNVVIVYSDSPYQLEDTIRDHYLQYPDVTGIIRIRLGDRTQKVAAAEWICGIDDPDGFQTCLMEYDAVHTVYFISDCQGEPQAEPWDRLAGSQQSNEIQLLRLVKYLKRKEPAGHSLDCYILTQDNYRVADSRINPNGGGVTGLAYAVAQGEYRFLVRNIDISREDLLTARQRRELLGQILSEAPAERGEPVKFQAGGRYKQQFLKAGFKKLQAEPPFKTGGVYVILGGSGTVGGVITRYLIQKYRARVVWVGRRPETAAAVQTKLDSWRGWSEPPLYVRADVTRCDQMTQALARIKRDYPVINGAIFAGLVLNFENSIAKTDETEFLEILDLKTRGSLNFYRAFAAEPLDFMCYFSSAQAFSFSGAANLSAYAAGITFSDTLVRYLKDRAAFPVGTINWGFWKASLVNSLSRSNVAFLEDEEGFRCFEEFIDLLRHNRLQQAIYLKTTPALRQLMRPLENEFITVYADQGGAPVRPEWHPPKTGAVPAEAVAQGGKAEELEQWGSRLLWAQMSGMGLFQGEGDPAQLCQAAGIPAKYQRWLAECIRIFCAWGYLAGDSGDERFRPLKPGSGDSQAIWQEWDAAKPALLQNPDWAAQARLMERCLARLPEILQGGIPATDILFPNASMELVEGIYRGNALSDYINNITADYIEACVQQRLQSDPRAQVRLIEAGAGTGGTSAGVLARLKAYADRMEYCYTDISKSFLLFGAERYGPDHPYLTFKLWNVEKPVAGQAIGAGEYDLALAANVLHATKDIRRTLRNIKAVLKKNGVLVISEGIRKSVFTTVTFGLLDGWWAFEDERLRLPGAPLLAQEVWRRVLEEEGFQPVDFLAGPDGQLGLQVMAAVSDGIVRQAVSGEPNRELDLTPSETSGKAPALPAETNRGPSLPELGEAITGDFRSMGNAGIAAQSVAELVKNIVMTQLARALKTLPADIDSALPFSDYGVDSIIGVSFVNQVNQELGAKLNSAIIFDYTTADRLTGYIVKTYGRQLQEKARTDMAAPVNPPRPGVADLANQHRAANQGERPRMAGSGPGVEHFTPESIAIIGMAGQFPGANDVNGFWRNLVRGADGVRELPPRYLDQSRYFSPRPQPGKTYCKWGGILEERDCFDPLFFNIAPREAESMNPHQRLILQESWKALEDAGYNPQKLADSKVGVFIGAEPTGYFYESFTGASDAIIASRLSYYLDLKGPALVVNTACSSSGVAIHLACESLRDGESSLAIAGGVSAKLDQSTLIMLAEIEMLSRSGRCHSFDAAADGTVMSEGVGVVVLKRLDAAIADGDPVYGVIRGSGVNQDGTSNGITAPNGAAQEELITGVYRRFGIDPEQITYVEAHGTGTRLGDPVEVNALARAFRQFTAKEGYCAIGSVKSAIGHTGAAAAVIGLIKVLLSFRHHMLPGLLHFNQINPLIELEGSAFYVNPAPLAWPSPEGRPLTAALSSFGHSGTNVHLVVHEYLPAAASAPVAPLPGRNGGLTLAPLSAADPERLTEYAAKLLEYLEEAHSTALSLAAVAYTLQTGRAALEERVIFLVRDLPELMTKLTAFLEGRPTIENCCRGRVKPGQSPIRGSGTDRDWQETVKQLIGDGEFLKMAELWAQGYEVDWELLWEARPRRINLPAYPFAKERYWMPKRDNLPNASASSGTVPPGYLHPLVHRNSSGFTGCQFSSTFTGQEFFLADHVVRGRRVLPGVAYLEMARVAVALAAGGPASPVPGAPGIRLQNIIWARPVTVGAEPVQVRIGLCPGADGTISYEISSGAADDPAPAIHSRGTALFTTNGAAPALDLTALRAQCTKSLTAEECYHFLSGIGFEYGPGHRGIKRIYVGSGQTLAQLALPVGAEPGGEPYLLHPGMMDSATQAAIGLMDSAAGPDNPGGRGGLKPALPFALEEVEIWGGCAPEMWVWIRYSETPGKPDTRVRKMDIDLCDAEGRVRVRMKGYSLRVPEGETAVPEAELPAETLMLRQEWKPVNLTERDGGTALRFGYTRHLIIICEPKKISREKMEAGMQGGRCLILRSEHSGIAKRFQIYAIQVLEALRAILKEKGPGRALVQMVVFQRGEGSLYAGLFGLLRTARLENPKVNIQLFEMEAGEDGPALVARLLADSRGNTPDSHIRYQNGQRYVATLTEVEPAGAKPDIPWKDRGVYLITGGAGGLGMILAREIAAQTGAATLILTGRSPLNREKEAALAEMAQSGTRIEYRQVDVTEPQAVSVLLRGILEEFGRLDGIIHSAGILKDNFIIKKTKEELAAVLAPKVAGVVNLDQASRNIPLDWFILFSSLAGAAGNAGQADYAAANAFLDVYAGYRNRLVESKQRHGRTISVNWPLWSEGGMQVDPEKEKLLRNTGMSPMAAESGIRALYQGLASGRDRVMVLAGERQRLRAAFLGQPEGTETPLAADRVATEAAGGPAPGNDLTMEQVVHYLKTILSSVIRLPVHRIEAATPFEKYGFDSIMVMKLTGQLEQSFGSLSKTLFYEYQNLQELAGYFIEAYREQLQGLIGVDEKIAAAAEKTATALEGVAVPAAPPGNFNRPLQPGAQPHPPELPTRPAPGASDIAIIGVAGRYPKANNLREFWENLRDGKDCITEIPKERWDYNLYFDQALNQSGKTYSKWGGFIEGVDRFDPLFFNISPREAANLDPQERLFLQCVYETLEDAGYTREGLGRGSDPEGDIGVYVGVMYEEYQLYGAQAQLMGNPIALPGIPSSIANRVSYFCNFHGPSLTVDTMCSSSLTAIHLACQSIQSGECALAVAGGVNLSIHPNKYLMLAQGNFASSKGRCESFGQGGDGYVPGEGVGAVLLKPLDRAVADGDHIYGIIKATAANHGGKTNGYSVPNPNAQTEVIGRALRKTGLNPGMISYIEAHGTGTALGDPIEITGLTKAFREYTQEKQFCAIGSVKSNIGHCESAAGIAAVTKVLLQIKYGQLVPSLHSQELNSNIDFDNTPFKVQRELAEWRRPVIGIDGARIEAPRIAGVSAFGAGGSNAHVIIAEYLPPEPEPTPAAVNSQNPALIVLSAKKEEQLKQKAEQLLAALREQRFSDADLADIAYTLQAGREAMEERLALIAGSIAELEVKLNAFGEGRDGIAGLYYGQVKSSREALSVFTADDELREAVAKWVSRGKYGKILNLWVKGMTFDWNQLYPDRRPRRLSLPTYPFARERCWVAKIDTCSVAGRPATSLAEPSVAAPARPAAPAAASPRKSGSISLKALTEVQAVFPPLDQAGVTVVSLSSAATPEPGGITSAGTPVETGTRLASIVETLTASLAETLFLERDELDTNQQFVDLGLDSVLGVEWIQKVNQMYGITLMATKVYEYPSIRELARFLQTLLPGARPTVAPETSPGRENPAPDVKPVIDPANAAAGPSPSSLPLETIEADLTASLAETLCMESNEVDPDRQFVDLGLDSVLGVEWTQTINKRYGTAILATKVYEYPTVREMARFLRQEFQRLPAGASPVASLDEVIEEIRRGALDTGQAGQLLTRFIETEE